MICDSNLVVSQVRNQFATKNDRLRNYRNAVWEAIETFDAFGIRAVPREENTLADELYVITSTFEVLKSLSQQECKVEVLFRPCL